MNWHTSLSWLSALTSKPADHRAGDIDRADMGTAFGLDASFGPCDDEPPPAAPTAQSPPPWEHRLTRRSSL